MNMRDWLLALGFFVFSIVGVTFCAGERLGCERGWFMSEPGICQRITPEKWSRGPRGGWQDDSEPGEQTGFPLYCTGGSRLRQDGSSAWRDRSNR